MSFCVVGDKVRVLVDYPSGAPFKKDDILTVRNIPSNSKYLIVNGAWAIGIDECVPIDQSVVAHVSSPKPQECKHVRTAYVGFTDAFDFCALCDARL